MSTYRVYNYSEGFMNNIRNRVGTYVYIWRSFDLNNIYMNYKLLTVIYILTNRPDTKWHKWNQRITLQREFVG